MKLIQSLQPLLAQGIALTLKLSASGENKIQLDIIPVGKDNKAGIALPAKAVIGSAQELDEGLEDFLAKYSATVGRVANIAADADAELQALEKQATEQARKALEEKRNKQASPTKSVAKSSGAPAKSRDMTAGLMGGDDEGGGESDADDDDNSPGTTLNTDTAGAETPPAGAAAEGSPALSANLF